MPASKRISIYTGGIPLFLFSFLILLSMFGFVGTILHFSWKGFSFFGCLLFAWMISYFIIYLLSNRISVTDTTISFSFVSREINRKLFPIVEKSSVALDAVRAILLGKPKHVKEFLTNQRQGTDFDSNVDITGLQYRLTPVIQILLKDSEVVCIDTKPFTKKNIFRILKALKASGIAIVELQ
jgi:hypothetical protein